MNTFHSVERELKNEIMSTDIFIRIESDTHSEETMQIDLSRCFDMFRTFELRFSRFKQRSELSLFNDNHTKKQQVSESFFTLLEKSGEYHLFTEGLFNPTILPALEKEGSVKGCHEGVISSDTLHESDSPILSFSNIEAEKETFTIDTHGARLDFGGIGKGYIIDQVALFLRSQGYYHFFIDAGGDLYARGKSQEKKYACWVVDIENPKYPDQSLATLALSDKAMTTSSINRQHWINGINMRHHIIDPRTGKSAETDLVSVTVIAHETALADVIAKSILILGRAAGEAFAIRKNIAALLADAEGVATTTPEFDKYIWKE